MVMFVITIITKYHKTLTVTLQNKEIWEKKLLKKKSTRERHNAERKVQWEKKKWKNYVNDIYKFHGSEKEC
jgi:hypothetical protein